MSGIQFFTRVSSALLLSTLLLLSCGREPPLSSGGNGSVEIRSCIVSPPTGTRRAKTATVCDSMVIEVSGPDITTIRRCMAINPFQPVRSDTLAGIPSGSERQISVFTIDRNGEMIHMDSAGPRVIRIEPNATAQVNVLLVPAMGSLFLQLENIPTKVDSVVASFVAGDSLEWSVRSKRSSKLFMAIDRIPHGTQGTLTVAALDTASDTLYKASRDLTFSARSMENILLTFSSMPGQLIFGVTIMLPGVTSASANVAAPDTSIVESGELLITEIMYAANDSEYVALYNPGSEERSFDSLFLVIDGNNRLFTDITVAAGDEFVIGRRDLPWADAFHSVASAPDLSSGGNWITLRGSDGRLIDRVVFTGGSNLLEWPSVSGKRSIVLDTAITDAAMNNFGRNWRAASELIPGTGQYGSPGVR